MQKYQDVVLVANGALAKNVQVQVLNYPALTPATIYSDNGITVAANPLTTDALGNFSFYAANGRYSLSVSGPGIQPITKSDVLISDMLPIDLPTSLPTTPGQLWNDGGSLAIS